MATQVFIWWLILQTFGLLGLPIAGFLFAALPDRGYAFSKTLGLLLTGYGAWLLAMFGLGSFGGPLVLLVMLLLAVLDALLMRRWQRTTAAASLSERLRELLRCHWRGILAYEMLFLAALVGMAWVRGHYVDFFASNPNPWFTERPMDFALLNAIRYNTTFPPPDPWLAGYSINYYYFGYLLMAVVALLSGLEPAVTYNLSLAGIFALTALGVAGVIANLIGLALQSHAAPTDQPDSAPQHAARYLFPLLGVVLVLLVGNQAGVLQVIVGDHRVVALDGPQLLSSVAQSLGSSDGIITLPYPAHTSEDSFGTFEMLERSDRFSDFNWWWPSRTLWDAYNEPGLSGSVQVSRYNITEFPFFSFWLGDMHPHVMALPFNLLVLALALAVLARADGPPFAVGRAGWLELLLTGVILGSLYLINSWDLPTYLLLYAGALLLCYQRERGHLDAALWKRLGKQMALVSAAIVLLFLPFYLTFRSLVGFSDPLIDFPVLSRITTIIAPFIGERSGLHAYLIIFGLFLVPLTLFVYLSAAVPEQPASDEPAPASDEPASTQPPAAPVPTGPAGPPRLVVGQSGALLFEETATAAARPARWQSLANPLLPMLLLAAGFLIGFPLLALAGLAILAFARALLRAAAPAERFVLLVVALGCAICFGTEIIYIRDVFGNRMNTIFKFYYQVWLLWGTMAAFALWWLLASPAARARAGGRRIAAFAGAALFLLLLAGGLVYPIINLRSVVQQGTWAGLEGRTPREQTTAGQASVRWLRENTPPGSVVLEMVGPGGGSYNGEGYAGVAAATGRPTVLGWSGHEIQWRGGDAAARAELAPREADVNLIYSTPAAEVALELLRKYDVDYIYVGALERQAYSSESLTKFDQLARPVFQMDEVTIYQPLTAEP